MAIIRILALLLLPLMAFGASPSFFDFRGTNGVIVYSNGNIIRIDALPLSNDLAAVTASSLSNKVDEFNGVATNLIVNGQTNIGSFTATQAVMSFGNTGNHVVLRQATDFNGAEFYGEDSASIFLKIRGDGALDFPLLSPNTILRLGVAGTSVSTVANASGALTNNGSGGVGYYPLFLSPSATNTLYTQTTSDLNAESNSLVTQITSASAGARGFSLQTNAFGGTVGGSTNFVMGSSSNIVLAATNTSSGNKTNSIWVDTIQPIGTNSSFQMQNAQVHSLTASKLIRTSGKTLASSTYDETDFALAATTNSFRTTVASNGTILALATNVDFHNFPRITNANGNISIGNDLSTITNIATNAIDLLVGQGVGNLTLLVKSNKTLYGFGDSQTAGNNATNAYYTSGGFLLPQYRWLSLVASNGQKGLAVSNWGIPGGRILMDLTGVPASIFNSMGRLTNTWQGIVTIMAGWNDLGNENTDPSLFEVLQHAYEAMIARALIDDYFGISYLGFTRTSTVGNDTPGWSTGVTDNNQITTSDLDSIPFPFSTGSAARYYVAMTGTNGLQFTFQSKRAGALFFDTDVNSGSASVLVNGVKYGDFSLIYGQGRAYRFPYVIWLNNLPDNAVITITNNLAANRTNFWLAAGYVNDFRQVPNRTVIIGPTTANSYCGSCTPAVTQRDNTNLFALMKSGEVTAAAMGDLGFPVYFANPYNGYVPQTDPEPSDPAHFTPEGNLHIAQAFLGAVRASGYKSSNVITLPNFPELSVSSNNVVLATAVTNLDFYGVNNFTNANGKVSIGFGVNGSTFRTNWISGQLYTNNSGSVIHVESGVNLVGAAVNGASTMLLMYDPAGGSSYTLLSPDSLTTVVTGFAVNITNSLGGDIASGGTFYYTNVSVGAGDSATLITGTGTKTVISIDPSSHLANNNGIGTNISLYGNTTISNLTVSTTFTNLGSGTNVGAINNAAVVTNWTTLWQRNNTINMKDGASSLTSAGDGDVPFVIYRTSTQLVMTNSKPNNFSNIVSFTIPAGLIGTNKGCYVTASGDYLQNSGTSTNFALATVTGTTTNFQSGVLFMATSASRRAWYLSAALFADNSASAQKSEGLFYASSPANTVIVGNGGLNTAIHSAATWTGTSAENSASTMTFKIAITFASGTNCDFRVNHVLAEVK